MTETICALATAPGGALGIIRISGDKSLEILSRVFSKDITNAKANTIHYGHIVIPNDSPTPTTTASQLSDAVFPHHGEVIDDVLVSVFHAPHSYTGENSAEISCHGSQYILNKVLELLVQNGCRIAQPGEYTMRAYLNGKMDLSQAEAVADLIASSNAATHHLAISQLRGGISSELSHLREKLLKLTSLLELELDFSDHEELEFADRKELEILTKEIDKRITTLAHSFEVGLAIKQGIPVAIVGKTNVGKSTLLNALLKDDRAIVSDIHGTTRDTIEDTIDINGVTFRFIDTAGIRQTSDKVEQIGIERTYAAIEKARIILWVIDKKPSQEELNKMCLYAEDKKLIVLRNKIDKSENKPFTLVKIPLIEISAKHRQGLSDLEQAIFQAADIHATSDSEVIITNARHYDALTRAHSHLHRVLAGMKQNISGDLLAEDLRLTIDTLSEITGGQITPNEVLGNIFKNFCVGK